MWYAHEAKCKAEALQEISEIYSHWDQIALFNSSPAVTYPQNTLTRFLKDVKTHSGCK